MSIHVSWSCLPTRSPEGNSQPTRSWSWLSGISKEFWWWTICRVKQRSLVIIMLAWFENSAVPSRRTVRNIDSRCVPAPWQWIKPQRPVLGKPLFAPAVLSKNFIHFTAQTWPQVTGMISISKLESPTCVVAALKRMMSLPRLLKLLNPGLTSNQRTSIQHHQHDGRLETMH